MKMLTLITIAATAMAVTLAPAAAKSKKHHRTVHAHYGQVHPGYGGGYYGGPQVTGYGPGGYAPSWNSRAVSDPSLGHPSADQVSRWNNGRCVQDLGYGRYEACGW